MHPKRSLEWQSCKPPGSPPPPPALALDGLSAPALASLKAAWWTKRLLTSYAGTLYDATHLYDQSGNGKTITSGASVGTAAEGADTALVFDASVPNTFTRGDALGLAADPALTVVWKMRLTADVGTFPTLLSMGTSGNSELSLSYDAGPQLDVANFDGSSFLDWPTLTGLGGWNTWVMTKPAGGGYANTWRLYRGVTNLGAPGGSGGALALGNTGLILGDFDGGGFPWGGNLAGMLVFERELTGADLALVQAL